MKRNLIIVILIIVIFAILNHYYMKKSYIPGAIYFTQADQKLKTVLRHSGIKENLTKYYEFEISESALNSMINHGRYSSCSAYKFWRDYRKQIYTSLLVNIYIRNIDKIECDIDENTKVIYIKTKNEKRGEKL